jgi:uncharacterized protein
MFSRILTILLLLFFFAGAAASGLPQLVRVVDEADVISEHGRRWLNDKSEEFEKRTGQQVFVVTVSSLHGQTMENYSRALRKKWQIDRREKSKNIILLIAPNEGKAHVEISDDLLLFLDNQTIEKIIQLNTSPPLSENQIEGGVLNAAKQIYSVLQPAPPSAPWHHHLMFITLLLFLLPLYWIYCVPNLSLYDISHWS